VSGVKRAARVAERLREELAVAARGLSDPRVAGVIISRAELTDDLRLAKVFVRHERGVEADGKRALLKGLEAASGRLRRAAAQSLDLRYAPALRFYYDEAPDAAQRIEELLREIKS